MRKGEMAETAEGILALSGWLPEPLRTLGRRTITIQADPEGDAGLRSEAAGDAAQDGAKTENEDAFESGAEVEVEDEAEPVAEPEAGADAESEANTPRDSAAAHAIAAE